MLSIAATGLLSGLSLIVAIGAQNAFVLRQGIRREHVGIAVLICALSDLLLISAGTLGIGVLVKHVPWLLVALRWGGVAYLLWFAVRSFRSMLRPSGLEASGEDARSVRSVALTTLALTYLNPHVYLDTVLMLGNLAQQHRPHQWWFSVGAMVGSIVWFNVLGWGARALAHPLARPGTWRIVDGLIGVVMVLIAVKLAIG